MSKIEFTTNNSPTVGIELELGLVDGNTMALSSSIQPMLEAMPADVPTRPMSPSAAELANLHQTGTLIVRSAALRKDGSLRMRRRWS